MARIEHFAIFAADLEGVRRFYETAFGLRVILDNSRAPVRGYFLADDAGTALEIIERPVGVPAPDTRYSCHTAFAVDDYSAARRALEAQGVRFETDTEVISDTFRTGFFSDPDGNRCQIVWRSRPLGP
jgi:glyoxylase I family protein